MGKFETSQETETSMVNHIVQKQQIKQVWSIECCGCHLVAQLYPTLCDPMDCSRPNSSVPGISQARILKRVAISFSKGLCTFKDSESHRANSDIQAREGRERIRENDWERAHVKYSL